ncbi:MFS transporter [Ornithinimicrobium sp. INDO-MA30-4]|uniref:MFS transporter n=1 Tax=Ornithinimicrobium sp. INDO-MA30-4 TaxID=2908651 RepID=UPI001F2B2E4F|nr:MFS transporter [Ornithinimicrobium sp. INDO-MA30-4]UJH71094.1 MFS transporter [Ornithinimicrobium sp. INDO-MA30-4]
MTQPGSARSSGKKRHYSRKHQRAWSWYDWANSAFVTTTGTVLIAPYLTALARADACPDLATDETCSTALSVLGVPIAVGSLAPYTVTVSTIVSAVFLLFVGAIADRSANPTKLLGAFAWAGSIAAMSMFFLSGSNWQLGVMLLILANLCLGSSIVIYDALLVRVAHPDDRDKVSSRGWALGYAGGGLLLALNLGLLQLHESLGITEGMAVRISLFSAGLWWAIFTLIPVLGLRNLPAGVSAVRAASAQGGFSGVLQELRHTFGELRHYPQTLMFLLAYLFFNDGIQTVIYSASLYGSEQLKFDSSQLILTILLVQFVAVAGALLFGAMAARLGAKTSVLIGLMVWIAVVMFAFFVPAGAFTLWLACAACIGLVLGGTQALSRSMYSQLVPVGKESEFFSFYQAMERGTSWFGTLAFGLTFQLTGSYRAAILILIVFFVVGGILLLRVNMRAGIAAAGNEQPIKV